MSNIHLKLNHYFRIKYLIERIKNNQPKFSVKPQKADDLKKSFPFLKVINWAGLFKNQ